MIYSTSNYVQFVSQHFNAYIQRRSVHRVCRIRTQHWWCTEYLSTCL